MVGVAEPIEGLPDGEAAQRGCGELVPEPGEVRAAIDRDGEADRLVDALVGGQAHCDELHEVRRRPTEVAAAHGDPIEHIAPEHPPGRSADHGGEHQPERARRKTGGGNQHAGADRGAERPDCGADQHSRRDRVRIEIDQPKPVPGLALDQSGEAGEGARRAGALGARARCGVLGDVVPDHGGVVWSYRPHGRRDRPSGEQRHDRRELEAAHRALPPAIAARARSGIS